MRTAVIVLFVLYAWYSLDRGEYLAQCRDDGSRVSISAAFHFFAAKCPWTGPYGAQSHPYLYAFFHPLAVPARW